MSSTQSKSITVEFGSGSTYFNATKPAKADFTKSSKNYVIGIPSVNGGDRQTVDATNALKNKLFPNKTVYATKCDASFTYACYSGNDHEIRLTIGNTEVQYVSFSNKDFKTNSVSNVTLSGANYNGTFSYWFHDNQYVLASIGVGTLSITLYFTRYDFSASAGANVTSASVSSSTGYDGDTIQYRCTLDSGAEWQGWYKDGALYSATKDLDVTVNGADLALEARATMPVTTKTLSATYNGAQLQGFPMSVQADAPITYGGVSKGTVPFSGAAKTLTCANKICRGNIGIGSKTLQCAGKMMATDVVCQIT